MFKLLVLRFLALGTCSGEATDLDVASDLQHVQLLQHRLQVESKAQKKGQASATPLPPLGFVKTHKTASSTVASVLQRLGAARGWKFVLPADDIHLGWPGQFPGPASAEWNDEPAQQYDAICNHAVYSAAGMRAYLKPNPFMFSVLRDPMTQSASAFDFFTLANVAQNWDERLTYLKLLRDTPRPLDADYSVRSLSDDGTDCIHRAQFQNPQAHDMGWYNFVQNTSNFDSDNDKIQAWLGSLNSQLDFVILTEAFDEGLVLLAEKLGLELEDVRYVYQNAGTEHVEPNNEQMTELRQLLNVDTKLYEHFKQAFWREWEDAGGYQTLGVKMDRLAALNKELEQACVEGNEDVCTWSMAADVNAFTTYLKQRSSNH